MIVQINQQKELSWKDKNGNLKPIKNLTNEELKAYRKIACMKADKYTRNMDFFLEILTQMDSELHARIEKAEQLVNDLKLAENEI